MAYIRHKEEIRGMAPSEKRKQVILAMLIATFLAAIEATIVSTAMPRIVSELGGLSYISWVVALYLFTSIIATPIAGKLADLYGRKVVFIGGTIVFLLGSLLSGLSQTMGQLIGFRALQGLGAGVIVPVTMTIIGDLFNYEERARVQGWFSAVWGLSGVVGPLVGGFIVDHLSWRWIFTLNVPFGIISVWLIMRSLKETVSSEPKKIDIAGTLTFTLGIAPILYAFLTGGVEHSWSSPIIWLCLALGAAGMAWFIRIEMRVEEPLLPLALFRQPVMMFCNVLGFLTSAILVAITVYLPVWVQGVAGKGATESGLVLLPMSVTWTLGSIVGGRWMLKTGPRTVGMMGLLLIGAGNVGLALVGEKTSTWMFGCLMGIEGLGFGLSTTVFTVMVQTMASWEVRGAATALNSFSRSLGQVIGIAFFGLLFNRSLGEQLPQGMSAVSHGEWSGLFHPQAGDVSTEALQLMREALAFSLHHIFVVLLVLSVFSLFPMFRIPKHAPTVQTVRNEG